MAQGKKGHPQSDNSLKDRIFIRVDNNTKEMFDKCKERLNTTRSDVVRKKGRSTTRITPLPCCNHLKGRLHKL